jgi:hypothetical protein
MMQDDYGNDLLEQYGWLVILFGYGYGDNHYNNDGYLCEYYD